MKNIKLVFPKTKQDLRQQKQRKQKILKVAASANKPKGYEDQGYRDEES